ncbi:unnamed protein product [Rhizophagus irregularis]|uniref:Uncharacterized protein n=1 Tax=Rhizophagus irregularis TaxID=588596 RepID=A0A915ZXE0_9GLOM|nr:unnamed protein product [Rhizophagus irregularis]
MDLKYDVYWDGKRVDRHIRKFIDNICESTLEAAWSFNRAHRTTFQDTTCVIEEKVTWALFKKNTGLNCTTSTINDRFIKHLKLTNNLLPTLEIMKERKYDLYGDVKCRMCLEENEDDDHIIYCQQLRDKWLVVANNTRKFFVHTTDSNQELPISHAQLMIKNFFPKEKYREIKLIVKSEKAILTITTLLLEIFVNEFYRIIWQPRCNLITEWEHIKGIKKQDLRKKIPAYQRITYERTPTQQIDGATYDLKGRKILKHSEQWSIALGKTRQYIDQFIREGNRVIWKEDIGEFYIGDGRAQEQSIGWELVQSFNRLVIHLADNPVISYN